MIICGYPGIGKSTLSKSNSKFIDLDSSNFRYYDGTRDSKWWQPYTNVAVGLHN